MNKSLKKSLYLFSAVLMISGIGGGINQINGNAKRRTRTHRVSKRYHKRSLMIPKGFHRIGGRKGKYRYRSLVPMSYSMRNHYFVIRYNVPVYNVSTKNVDMAHNYTIGKRRIMKRGSIVKGYFDPTSPSGFEIGKAKGFNQKSKYERKHDASWMIRTKMHYNHWIAAVK